MTCTICSSKYHAKCLHFSQIDVDNMLSHPFGWICIQCNGDIFPFNHLAEDDMFTEALFELNFEGTIDLQKIKDIVFNPFVLNENANIPLFETDPDLNFTTKYLI